MSAARCPPCLSCARRTCRSGEVVGARRGRTLSAAASWRFGILVMGAAVIALPATAFAGLYKCALDNGSVTYQQDPCPPGKELRDFDRDPANVSVVPFSFPPGTESRGAAAAPRSDSRRKTERRSRKADERRGNAAERKFLFPGISEGEVVARVGQPDMSTGGGRKTTRWTYMPAPDDPATITTLTFQFGRLVEVERKVVRTR
ncbi:MAG: DUF4124 domain-containing protein [Casimicrobiaceae bacterium]